MDKPTIPEVLPAIRAYYAKPGNSNGGNLHIVLEDPNYEDDDVRFCIATARDAGDSDGVAIAKKMLLMSKTQREKLASMDHQQIRRGGLGYYLGDLVITRVDDNGTVVGISVTREVLA